MTTILQERGVNMKYITNFLLIWTVILALIFLYIKWNGRVFIEREMVKFPPSQQTQILEELDTIDTEEELAMFQMRIEALQFMNGSEDDKQDYQHFIKLGKN